MQRILWPERMIWLGIFTYVQKNAYFLYSQLHAHWLFISKEVCNEFLQKEQFISIFNTITLRSKKERDVGGDGVRLTSLYSSLVSKMGELVRSKSTVTPLAKLYRKIASCFLAKWKKN